MADYAKIMCSLDIAKYVEKWKELSLSQNLFLISLQNNNQYRLITGSIVYEPG